MTLALEPEVVLLKVIWNRRWAWAWASRAWACASCCDAAWEAGLADSAIATADDRVSGDDTAPAAGA